MAQVKRSISIKGHRTSYTLEAEFHEELERLCELRGLSVAGLVAAIDKAREPDTNLSSALRLAVLHHLKDENAKLKADL